jgi:ribosome-associated heat shock protein Hsp15
MIVDVVRPPITYSYEILGLLGNRQSAKIVVDYLKDVTSQDEKNKLEIIKLGHTGIYREKGKGRPTKKERREIDDFLNEW